MDGAIGEDDEDIFGSRVKPPLGRGGATVYFDLLDTDDRAGLNDSASSHSSDNDGDGDDFCGAACVKQITSAGILPFAVFKKRVYFLLGKEAYEPRYGDSDRWSDFSGSIELGESIEDGACREFYEETAGCIFHLPEVRQKINRGEYLLHADLHPRKSASLRTYLLAVPFRDYPAIFRKVKLFLQYPAVQGNVKIIEKSQLNWFSFNDLRDIVFYRWNDDRYRRKPKLRAKFSENIRRIMSAVDLRQQCIDAHAISV